jgi:hypothetical protein
MRLLASIGVFGQQSDDCFALNPLGEPLLSVGPGSVRNFAITETALGHWLPWDPCKHGGENAFQGQQKRCG